MNKNKKILLFDLDGTLTLPRKKLTKEVLEYLEFLRKRICIGVVSGSDLLKINQQLGRDSLEFFDYTFPENGSVAYRKKEKLFSQSIAEFLGEETLKSLINFLLSYLSKLEIPIKRGTFIDYRCGVLNVCPVGRNCSYEERLEFKKFDAKNYILENLVKNLKEEFSHLNLCFVIGGQISVDIFPQGRDKSFCLQFLENDFQEIHFFGDKTNAGGNDFEIYEDKRTIGHRVANPQDTLHQVKQILSSG